MATLSHLERGFTLSMPHVQKSPLLVIANLCVGKDTSVGREEKIQAYYRIQIQYRGLKQLNSGSSWDHSFKPC